MKAEAKVYYFEDTPECIKDIIKNAWASNVMEEDIIYDELWVFYYPKSTLLLVIGISPLKREMNPRFMYIEYNCINNKPVKVNIFRTFIPAMKHFLSIKHREKIEIPESELETEEEKQFVKRLLEKISYL